MFSVMRWFFLFFVMVVGSAQAEPLRIVASPLPVHGIASWMVRDVAPRPILLATGDPHHHTLTPSMAHALRTADLVIWGGKELQPAIAQIPFGTRGWDISKVSGLTRLKDIHGREDVHVWLSPHNAMRFAEELAHILTLRVPNKAKQVRANLKALLADMGRVSARVETMLTPVRHREWVVEHDGWNYFTDAYGLKRATPLHDANHLPTSPKHQVRAHTSDACVVPDLHTSPSNPRSVSPAGIGIVPGPRGWQDTMLRAAYAFSSCP